MTKDQEKIIRWLSHGVDDRFIILDLIKQTFNDEFYLAAKTIIDFQTETDEYLDLDNKLARLMSKGDAVEHKYNSNPVLAESMYQQMMVTTNKLLEQVKKVE